MTVTASKSGRSTGRGALGKGAPWHTTGCRPRDLRRGVLAPGAATAAPHVGAWRGSDVPYHAINAGYAGVNAKRPGAEMTGGPWRTPPRAGREAHASSRPLFHPLTTTRPTTMETDRGSRIHETDAQLRSGPESAVDRRCATNQNARADAQGGAYCGRKGVKATEQTIPLKATLGHTFSGLKLGE